MTIGRYLSVAAVGAVVRYRPQPVVLRPARPSRSRPDLPSAVAAKLTPADHEALRAAQLRRERKAARQAKGFR
jgi:hypothetical protein